MGKAKKTRKFSVMKKMVQPKDKRADVKAAAAVKKREQEAAPRSIPQVSSSLFFRYNEALKPPYQVLIDTNFINFSIQKKIDLVQGMMDALYARCVPMVTDCVLAELEKLGPKYRIALRMAKDPRVEHLKCSHKGTYADDCIVERIIQHKCYIVATNDADLKRRVRKVPGIPLMSVGGHSYVIEKLPQAF